VLVWIIYERSRLNTKLHSIWPSIKRKSITSLSQRSPTNYVSYFSEKEMFTSLLYSSFHSFRLVKSIRSGGSLFQVRDQVVSVLVLLETSESHFSPWDVFLWVFQVNEQCIFLPDPVSNSQIVPEGMKRGRTI
jgi:hypothetical protein